MFMVINKDKVISYLISLSTVAMLFLFSFIVSKKNDEMIRTSANAIDSNINSKNIYYVQSNENIENNTNTSQYNFD